MSEKPTYQELEQRVWELERAESERNIAEIVQRSPEGFFDPFFEKHNAVMLLIEPNSGDIINANIAAQKYYGYSISTLKQMKIQEINTLSPDEIAEKRQQAASERANFFEFPHRLSSGEIRTVEVHSSPMIINDKKYLISVIHDITARKEAEEALQKARDDLEKAVDKRTCQLQEANKNLEKLNTGLQVVIEHRKEEMRRLEKNVVENANKLIMPYIDKIDKDRMSNQDRAYLELAASNIEELVSPFSRRLSSGMGNLTPAQIQIADLIKKGKTSQEIASTLNISINAVTRQRFRIRKRLNLLHRKVNLRSYLQALGN